MTINLNANPAWEIVKGCTLDLEKRDEALNGLIDELQAKNMSLKTISTVTNKLAAAKTDKKCDLNRCDEKTKKCILLIHLSNDSIFGNKINNLPHEAPTLEAIHDDLRQRPQLQNAQITLDMILNEVSVDTIQFGTLSEDDIGVILQGLEGETKNLSIDVNQKTTEISHKYERHSKLMELSHQILKECQGLSKSIIAKMRN